MNIFYEADDGSQGTGGTFSESASEVFGTPPEAPPPEETVSGGAGGGGDGGAGTPSKPATEGLTPEQITQAVREGVRPEPVEPRYTQEQLDQIFKVWKPNEAFLQQLLAGGPEAMQALLVMRDGLAGQFGQLVQYQMEVLKRELEEMYSPAVTFAQEARSERDRENFFKLNEDLREHTQVVDIAYKSLLGEGKQFATLELAQKALADRARQLIPNGNGSGTTPSGGARQTTTATKPKPAALSSGGGAGGSGGSSAPPNVFHEIFGPQR